MVQPLKADELEKIKEEFLLNIYSEKEKQGLETMKLTLHNVLESFIGLDTSIVNKILD